MAKCGYCGSTIIMGGVSAGGQRFCNNNCHRSAYILSVSRQVPAEVVQKRLEEVWGGMCPKCLGPGPVDVHRVYQVWSALILTRWMTKQQVSCKSCAAKSQAGGAAFSLVAGWWGFPWGLILTPVQVTRNIIAMAGGPDQTKPSEDLRKLVMVNIGTQAIAAAQQQKAAAAPPPLPSNT